MADTKSLGRDLSHLFLDEHIPELDSLFTKEENLESLIAQAKKTVAFMTGKIPEEFIIDERKEQAQHITPFLQTWFKDILDDSYNRTELEDLYIHIAFAQFPAEQREQIFRTARESNDLKKEDYIQAITSFMYDTKGSIKRYQQKLAKNQRYRSSLNLVAMSVETHKAKILLDVLKRNKRFAEIGRKMSYKFVSPGLFELTTDPFFSEQEKYGKDAKELTYARFAFGMLTAHIDYFKKPQVGKWEIIYTTLCNFEPDDIEEGKITLPKSSVDIRYAEFPKRKPEEKIKDIERQTKADVILHRYLVHTYSKLFDKKDAELEESRKEIRGLVSLLESRDNILHEMGAKVIAPSDYKTLD